ncbi:MAG: hypothetical protein WC744_00540 [Patescibacteria group bacterium]|jgi:hypothetical protein
MEVKKDGKQKESATTKLQKFRIKQLNDFKTKVIVPIEKLHWKEIKKFKDDWGIKTRELKNNKILKKWLKEIQTKYPNKKYSVLIFEVEKFHEIEDEKIIHTVHSDFVELEPRITFLGDSPKIVFDYEVKLLMNQLNLDLYWIKLFKQYLLFGRDQIDSIRNPSLDVTERITYGKNPQQLEHRIALNISPNTSLEEIQLLWDKIIKPLQIKIRGHWLNKKRITKLQPLLEKLIDLDIEDQKTGIHRSDYEKADILFGSIDDNKKYNNWSPERIKRLENKRIKRIANLRRQYNKFLISQ